MKRNQESESLRERVLRRDRYRCVYCGSVLPPSALTLDHVQPRIRGGDHTAGNVVAACRSCNTEKGGSPAWSYLAERPQQRENFLTYARGVWPRHRRAVLEAAEKRRG